MDERDLTAAELRERARLERVEWESRPGDRPEFPYGLRDEVAYERYCEAGDEGYGK